MIPVPEAVRAELARRYGAEPARLRPFAGGREENDGVLYAYPHGAGKRAAERLLKIMAFPAADRARGLFVLGERARFMRFLGDRGAQVACPVPAPDGALYATLDADAQVWVAYSMEVAPGRTVPWDTWDPALFTAWGQAVGRLHRLARDYPSWDASVDPATGARYLTWNEEWQGFLDMGMEDAVAERWL
ncbi:MAG: hypothetical protein V1772_06035, partial [Chloroflexota bacterium]